MCEASSVALHCELSSFRFVLLEGEVNTIFEDEGLEHQGNAAMEGLKQFMYNGTDGLPLVVVS